jgi:hypothetical protein
VFVNLNRQGTGHAAHWGFIEESVNACAMFNGSIEPALQTRFSASKNKTEAFFAANEKQTNRGYTHHIEVVTKKGVAHTVFLEAFLAQLAVVIAAKRMNNSCGIKKADIGNDAATKLVDFAGSISVAAMVV